jgi:transcriptional regulator with XRE-family HTH domain
MPTALQPEDMVPKQDARLAERMELYTEAEGLLTENQTESVRVHNMSTGGVLLESETPLSAGQRIHIRLAELGLVPAVVMWASEALYGCQFETPLSQSDVDVALASDPIVRQLGETPPLADAENGPSVSDFAARLRALREGRGLSLAALSRSAGISKPSIWAWETGKTVPRPRSVEALAQALGVSAAQIWGRDAPFGLIPATSPNAHVGADNGAESLKEVVAAAREAIAKAASVSPEHIRISIDY